MKVFKLTYPIRNWHLKQKIVLGLGFFDGVHLGHQYLISQAKQVANRKGLPLAIMTFDRHASEVFANNHDFQYIDTVKEKAAKMEKLGVDYFLVLKFTDQVCRISPQQFVDNVIEVLGADTVVAGFDYTYGPKEIANMDNLPKFADGKFEIVKVPKQTVEGEKIGSTGIRNAIHQGDMELVYDLMGSYYEMSGIVGHGKRNGHRLGYPTANLISFDQKVIPKIGVYATKTKVNGIWYDSMTSVGYNLTVTDENKIFIESNIFDFNANIYDQPITIKWYKYIRDEIKFDSLDELKEQLKKDEQLIKQYFTKLNEK